MTEYILKRNLIRRGEVIEVGQPLPEDIDDDTIDVEILNAMSVTQDHFNSSLSTINPAALRETTVEVPDVKWDDIGGLLETKKLL